MHYIQHSAIYANANTYTTSFTFNAPCVYISSYFQIYHLTDFTCKGIRITCLSDFRSLSRLHVCYFCLCLSSNFKFVFVFLTSIKTAHIITYSSVRYGQSIERSKSLNDSPSICVTVSISGRSSLLNQFVQIFSTFIIYYYYIFICMEE